MKYFVVNVLQENEHTGKISLGSGQYILMMSGIATGRYGGLEVRVKETGKVLHRIPAKYISWLVFEKLTAKKTGQIFQAADLTGALNMIARDQQKETA